MMKEFRLLILVTFMSSYAWSIRAQGLDLPPAVPAARVQAQAIASPQSSARVVKPDKSVKAIGDLDFSVLELYSSQACPSFCSKVDQLMRQYAQLEGHLMLSCHVSVEGGIAPLSLPICKTRQSQYEAAFNVGASYLPQLIVNGSTEILAYTHQNIRDALEKSSFFPVWQLMPERVKDGVYMSVLPDIVSGDYQVWLLVYEDVVGRSRDGRNVYYPNLVRKAGFLGNWDGQLKALKFKPKLSARSKGFALLVQDMDTMQIVAAGKFER